MWYWSLQRWGYRLVMALVLLAAIMEYRWTGWPVTSLFTALGLWFGQENQASNPARISIGRACVFFTAVMGVLYALALLNGYTDVYHNLAACVCGVCAYGISRAADRALA